MNGDFKERLVRSVVAIVVFIVSTRLSGATVGAVMFATVVLAEPLWKIARMLERIWLMDTPRHAPSTPRPAHDDGGTRWV